MRIIKYLMDISNQLHSPAALFPRKFRSFCWLSGSVGPRTSLQTSGNKRQFPGCAERNLVTVAYKVVCVSVFTFRGISERIITIIMFGLAYV